MKDIHTIKDDNTPKTCCAECCFARWNETGLLQTDCALGRLEKFAENGAEVLEAYNERADFFVISGRYCSGYRPKLWGEAHDNSNLILKLYEEIALKPTILIYADTNLDDVLKITDEIRFGDTDNLQILINCKLNVAELKKELNRLYEANTIKTWKIMHLNNDVNFHTALDQAINKVQDTYFYYVKTGSEFHSKYIRNVDEWINHDLKRLSLVDFGDEERILGQTLLFQKFAANRSDNYTTLNAIRHYSEDEKLLKYLVKVDELCCQK